MPIANQIRAARALIGWSQQDLADRSQLAKITIAKIELEQQTPGTKTIDRIIEAFDDAGVDFIGQEGVRKKRSDIMTYRGAHGLEVFMVDVRATIKRLGGLVCVSHVDEAVFHKWLGQENMNQHVKEMNMLANYRMRIMVREGDTNYAASSYAEYRWIPRNLFYSVPFYVYGNKLSLIVFGKDDLAVHVIENEDIAEAQRFQFNLTWDRVGIVPPGD